HRQQRALCETLDPVVVVHVHHTPGGTELRQSQGGRTTLGTMVCGELVQREPGEHVTVQGEVGRLRVTQTGRRMTQGPASAQRQVLHQESERWSVRSRLQSLRTARGRGATVDY